MASLREQILSAAETDINDTGDFTTVDRSRTRTLQQASCPAATIYPGTELVEYARMGPIVKRTLSWRVAIRAVGTDTTLDAYHVSVVSAIAGNTFGGLALQTREVRTEWVLEDADEILTGCDIEFATEYLTAQADEESAA